MTWLIRAHASVPSSVVRATKRKHSSIVPSLDELSEKKPEQRRKYNIPIWFGLGYSYFYIAVDSCVLPFFVTFFPYGSQQSLAGGT